MIGVKIIGVEIYHPKALRNNDYYLDIFENKENLTEIFNKVGRNIRYVIDNEKENSLTMGLEASNKVIKSSNLTGNDIDIVIFSSTTLEYLSPTNALILHSKLNIKNECICFDINANCLGMFVALEQASILLNSKESYKRALVVGSDYLSKLGDITKPIPSTIVGDAAAAIILEKTSNDSGMIDRVYKTDSNFNDTIVYPPRGLSCSLNQDEKIHWAPFSGIESAEFAVEGLTKLLDQNNFNLDDISSFFLSQFTKSNIDILKEKLKIPDEKIEYIGDIYGYTGVSSFFIAYKSRLDKGLLNSGDIIAFWTLGAGYQTGVMLWRV